MKLNLKLNNKNKHKKERIPFEDVKVSARAYQLMKERIEVNKEEFTLLIDINSKQIEEFLKTYENGKYALIYLRYSPKNKSFSLEVNPNKTGLYVPLTYVYDSLNQYKSEKYVLENKPREELETESRILEHNIKSKLSGRYLVKVVGKYRSHIGIKVEAWNLK